MLEVLDDIIDETRALVQEAMTSAFLDLFRDYDPAPLAKDLIEIGVGPNYAEAK